MGKLLVITGPTASGKTKLGLGLAKKFNGEILSADSRQVYVGNDVETGKDIGNAKFQIKVVSGEREVKKGDVGNGGMAYGYYTVEGVRIWGLDIVEPGYNFNVSDYQRYAVRVVRDIWDRGKLPIVVGGTGQYIKELLFPSETLHVPLDPKLRSDLEESSLRDLQERLKSVNPRKWQSMNQSDRNNPRRLIRAIETATEGSKKNSSFPKKSSSYNSLFIGLTAPRSFLYQKIVDRRRTRPDLVKKEFILAKKQLLYQKKFLPATWFDISEPGYQDRIISLVSTWYTRPDDSQTTKKSD